jgi:four helix bundle protein
MQKEYKTYHTLIMHQKANELALLSYKLTANFPKEELYGITNQIRRASVSVPANIAEGYSRNGNKEKTRFLNIAQGSLVELRFFFEFSRDLGYVSEEALDDIDKKITEATKLICGFIKKLNQSLVTLS